MPKVWNIGNTTVRNPKRIENALKVFLAEGFSGNAKGKIPEENLHAKLRAQGVLEFDGAPSDLNGRKWRAAFYQLGLISYEYYGPVASRIQTEAFFRSIGLPGIKAPYEMTPAGENLINAASVPEIDEIYCRQLACYELPSWLEPDFQGGKMKPFILFLQVSRLLETEEIEGLNRFETGLFLQKFRDHTAQLPLTIVGEVKNFRSELAACKNPTAQKALKKRYSKDLADFAGINAASITGDYSDTTFRYFSLSGLFSRVGDTLVIRLSKRAFVDELLKTEPNFAKDQTEYLAQFYKNTYALPTDNPDFALNEIDFLASQVNLAQTTFTAQIASAKRSRDLQTIQQLRHSLIQYNNVGRETDYAKDLQSASAVQETIDYLKALDGETNSFSILIKDDKPAYFEWSLWRSILAINEVVNPIHATRRFPVDEDFFPRNTAPGGGSDMIFEFETFVLAIEVTLTSSSRQMAVESEPVRRHTVK